MHRDFAIVKILSTYIHLVEMFFTRIGIVFPFLGVKQGRERERERLEERGIKGRKEEREEGKEKERKREREREGGREKERRGREGRSQCLDTETRMVPRHASLRSPLPVFLMEGGRDEGNREREREGGKRVGRKWRGENEEDGRRGKMKRRRRENKSEEEEREAWIRMDQEVRKSMRCNVCHKI